MWITWETYSAGYTEQDYLVHALAGKLPQIANKPATFQELQTLFAKNQDEKNTILAMRKSAKKDRMLKDWEYRFTNTIFTSKSKV